MGNIIYTKNSNKVNFNSTLNRRKFIRDLILGDLTRINEVTKHKYIAIFSENLRTCHIEMKQEGEEDTKQLTRSYDILTLQEMVKLTRIVIREELYFS